MDRTTKMCGCNKDHKCDLHAKIQESALSRAISAESQDISQTLDLIKIPSFKLGEIFVIKQTMYAFKYKSNLNKNSIIAEIIAINEDEIWKFDHKSNIVEINISLLNFLTRTIQCKKAHLAQAT